MIDICSHPTIGRAHDLDRAVTTHSWSQLPSFLFKDYYSRRFSPAPFAASATVNPFLVALVVTTRILLLPTVSFVLLGHMVWSILNIWDVCHFNAFFFCGYSVFMSSCQNSSYHFNPVYNIFVASISECIFLMSC